MGVERACGSRGLLMGLLTLGILFSRFETLAYLISCFSYFFFLEWNLFLIFFLRETLKIFVDSTLITVLELNTAGTV